MNQMNVINTTHSIHGGLHLDEKKAPACNVAIQEGEIPDMVVLPLNMHAGREAVTIVEVGENLYRGQIIAEAEGQVSANIHSPVNGKVVAIEPRPMSSRSGLPEMAIVIQTTETEIVRETPCDWIEALTESPEVIAQSIEAAGIVGLGGAGFPTASKIAASANARKLLINGAECEPYICCDDRTMRDYAEQVIGGAFLLAKAAACDFIEVATEDNKPEAIDAIKDVLNTLPEHMQKRIQLYVCPTKYPMGGERQLLEAITGQQVPSNTYPVELGYLVHNIGTALAVYNCMTRSEPLLSRMVTLTGEAIRRPGVYHLLLGTTVKDAIAMAGVDETILTKVIHGGPMMGYPLQNLDAPITKITNCLIAATADEIPPLPEEQPCIRCGQCVDVCPATLLPQQLYWFARSEEFEKAASFKIHDCIECGLCSYVCPSHIPLVDYYRYAKSEIKQLDQARIKSERSKVKFDARNDRLEQERMEKERIKAEKAKQRAANKAANKDKNDAVAAALARVKAKKAQSQQSNDTDNTSEDSKP